MDTYTRTARLQPALLVALPLGLATLAWFPSQLPGWGVIWGLVVWCGGTVLLAQLGREVGRHKEPMLFELWGGKPTTRMLRHRGGTNKTTLARWHRKLQELMRGMKMPSLEDEAADPDQADAVYESCSLFLREQTRDRTKFPLVFEENCNYGFRRNVWGLRPFGIATTLLGMFAVGALVVVNTRVRRVDTQPIVYLAGGVNAMLLVAWCVLVSPDWVKKSAEAYSEGLLSSCDNL